MQKAQRSLAGANDRFVRAAAVRHRYFASIRRSPRHYELR